MTDTTSNVYSGTGSGGGAHSSASGGARPGPWQVGSAGDQPLRPAADFAAEPPRRNDVEDLGGLEASEDLENLENLENLEDDAAHLAGDLAEHVARLAGEFRDEAERLIDDVRAEAAQVTSDLREEAARLADDARAEVRGVVRRRKERVADRLDGVASALRDAGERLDLEIGEGLGEVADRAAQQVEEASRYLSESEMQDMARDLGRFARRRPAIFVAGALVSGFLLARFLKSSGDRGVA